MSYKYGVSRLDSQEVTDDGVMHVLPRTPCKWEKEWRVGAGISGTLSLS